MVCRFAVLWSSLSPSMVLTKFLHLYGSLGIWDIFFVFVFAHCYNPMKERGHHHDCLQWENWEREKGSGLSMVMEPVTGRTLLSPSLLSLNDSYELVLCDHNCCNLCYLWWTKANGWLFSWYAISCMQSWYFQAYGYLASETRLA